MNKLMGKKGLVIATLAISMMLAACAKNDAPGNAKPEKEETKVTTENVESTTSVQETGFTFADIEDRAFSFSSGVGAWGTDAYIKADGSFFGHFSDSDMGDSSEEYENGTVYICSFDGQFSAPVKINDYTYSTTMTTLTSKQPAGKVTIEDSMRFITATPYGFEDGEEFYIFLPDAPVAELPQAYVDWVYAEGDQLGYYGLYNVKMEEGFSSYISEYVYQLTRTNELELQQIEIEKKLDVPDATQSLMNQVSGEVLKLWDDELNRIWSELERQMGKEEFEKLREEQRSWIASKEASVKEAGEEYKGGSMQPLVENELAARLTKNRVYDLLSYLSK